MSKPKVGNKAPDFTLPATGDQKIKLSALRGRPVVLYFYPKDSTPGCTQEGQDFRDRHADFAKHDTRRPSASATTSSRRRTCTDARSSGSSAARS
jgi:peroxiredoxin